MRWRMFTSARTTEVLIEQLASLLEQEPVLIEQLRLLVAISDKRLYLDLSYMFSRTLNPSDPRLTLCGCRPDDLTRHATSVFINLLSTHQRRGSQAGRCPFDLSVLR